jgi:hypothetical protein
MLYLLAGDRLSAKQGKMKTEPYISTLNQLLSNDHEV